PTTLTPTRLAGAPRAQPKGMTSARTPAQPPIIAPSPTRTPRRTPALPPNTVGRDVRPRHEKATVAYLGQAAVVLRADAHGDIFADVAVRSDDQASRAAAI